MNQQHHTSVMAARPLALTQRAGVAVALLVTLLASLVGASTPGAGAPALGDLATRVVVEARTDLGQVTAAVARHGGRVVDVLAPFGLVVADVPAGAVDALDDEASTGAMTPDMPLRVQSADVTSVSRATVSVTGDPSAGDGVGVVLVDTGIADHADLDDRVVARYTLAPDDGDDPHGHGTFLAGIIAGSGAASDGVHAGVAPAAHLVSVRVADATGETTLARVLHGLAVADVARERHDAPVVLLALSGEAGDVPDPVMMVLEMLWARGSTVVVAAGNQETVGSPGADPYLLTAGALDDQGTADTSDDVVPDWSGRGTHWGHTKPDLVAPGVSVIGLHNPQSTISTDNPGSVVDGAYFRGSGTSMSAALTAGAAAAVLAEEPSLTPAGVKGRLMGSAADAPANAGPDAAGAGVLDVRAALDSDAGPANTELAPLPTPRGNGRANQRAIAPGQLRRTAEGLAPAGWSWAGWTWAGWSWAGWTWDGWTWAGDADAEWAGWTWADQTWTGWTWAGWTWAGWTWDGWTWDGWTWDGWTWSAAEWGTSPS